MISRNDLDRLAQHRVVKIFRGEFCGGDRTGPAEIATAAVVAEHADADHAVGYAGAVLRMERGQSISTAPIINNATRLAGAAGATRNLINAFLPIFIMSI